MKKILVFSLLIFSLQSRACINIFAVDSAGRGHYLSHWFFFSVEFRQKEITQKIKAAEKMFAAGQYSYQNISDYGAWLLMAGRYAEGLDLFRALSKKYPQVYEINANTAVAYELNGNIDSALYWERASLKINPTAHGNSEWIHLKILEARKQLQADPDWCLHHNVTDVVNRIKETYKFEEHEDFNEGSRIFSDFMNQLEERFPFTYAEDKVMGKLMMELGDAYQAASIYRSYYCYALAQYLYPALKEETDEKMRLILMKYPAGTVESFGRAVSLKRTGNSESREMVAPDPAEVKRFIHKIIKRPAVYNKKIKPLNIQELVKKIG